MAEVEDAAVVMATEANKGLLKNAGLLTPEAEAATPNDLVIAVKGAQAGLGNIMEEAEKLLHTKQTESGTSEFRPKTSGWSNQVEPGRKCGGDLGSRTLCGCRSLGRLAERSARAVVQR